jgi:hypothetical protein
MKFPGTILAAVFLGAVVSLCWPLQAQTNISVSAGTDRPGRVVSYDQVNQELNRQLNIDDATVLDLLRAERPEYPKLSPEIRRKLFEFKQQRDRYLLEQERLIKQLKGATDAERDRIREVLREERLKWLERSRSFRESARERYRELLRELPNHREALEAARENARDQVQETRKRPGVD